MQERDASHAFRLLRPRRERPSCRCTGEQCDELAPLHGAYPKARDHGLRMPANSITFAHFSVYAAMNIPKSAGELMNTVPPRSATRAFIRGSSRPALISLLSLSMISA